MCIIAAKPVGSDWPTIDVIDACCQNNPDGFAIAWNEGGEVKTFRSMDRAEFLARYHTLSHTLDPNVTGAIVHARWATHGSKKLENCHCFLGGGLAFAHNGVLTNVPVRDDMTDSETFFRDYFLPVYETLGLEKALLISRAIAGTSRLAWIDGNGDIEMLGSWEKCQEQGRKGKVYYSNSGFRSVRNHYGYSESSFGRTQEVKRKGKAKAGDVMDVKTFRDEIFGSISKQGPLVIKRSA